MNFKLLFALVNEAQIASEEMEKEIREADFSKDLSLRFSYLDKKIRMPTDLKMRAAPWHICPVTKEFKDIGMKYCYSLNYCLMYIIDSIEVLQEKYSDVDCFVLLFPKSPISEGDFTSVDKKCICSECKISHIVDELSTFIRSM